MTFNQAWIGYQNLFTDFQSAITATNTDTGYDPRNVGNWQLFQPWQGSGILLRSDIVLSLPSATQVDYFAIAGHNLGSCVGNLALYGANLADFSDENLLVVFDSYVSAGAVTYNGSYKYNGATSYNAVADATNNVLGFALDPVVYKYYKVSLFGRTAKPKLGVCCLGKRLQFEMGFWGGFQVPDWNEDVQTQNNKSETGVFLGRSIVRAGLAPFTLTVEPVTTAWIDNYWMPFKRAADTQPFIFAWGDVPDISRAYCWSVKSGPNTARDSRYGKVSMNIEGTLV